MWKAQLGFALGTMVSRGFGLLRETVLAASFGASLVMDSFLVANRIPNLLRELVAEGALGASFTKVYAATAARSRTEAASLARATLAVAGLGSVVICLGGIAGAQFWVAALTPEVTRNSDFFASTVFLVRVLFPFIGLMAWTAIFQGILYEKKRFFTVALSPIALSFGYIFGATVLRLPPWFYRYLPSGTEVRGVELALGVLLGGAAHLLWLAAAARLSLAPWRLPSQKVQRQGMEILRLMAPMVLAASAGQMNVMVNTYFATSLGTGAVSWLTYAFRLVQLPIGVFAVGTAAVLLPELSRSVDDPERFATTLHHAVDSVTGLLSLAAAILWLGADDLVGLVYQYGAFGPGDRVATAACMRGYALGLVALGLIKVLLAAYYATGRTRIAMVIAFASVAVNALLGALLTLRWQAPGLSYAASLVVTFQAFALLLGLPGTGAPGRPLWKVLLRSAIFLGVVIWTVPRIAAMLPSEQTVATRLLRLSAVTSVCALPWLPWLRRWARLRSSRNR